LERVLARGGAARETEADQVGHHQAQRRSGELLGDLAVEKTPGGIAVEQQHRPAAAQLHHVRRLGAGLQRAALDARGKLPADPARRPAHAAAMIFRNESAFRQAPPTSAPSMSGCAVSSAAFSGLTLPPYRTRTAAATASPWETASRLRTK